MITLNRWSARQTEDGVRMRGNVTGHPTIQDGARITTSIVTARDKRVVSTQSHVYRLGDVDPRYVTWLAGMGIAFDAENPVLRGMDR